MLYSAGIFAFVFVFLSYSKHGRRQIPGMTGGASCTVATKGSASRGRPQVVGLAVDTSEWNQSATQEKQVNESSW